MPIRHELKSPPPHFWSWFAGFMDGDGAIVFERGQAKISILQKDRSPLDYIVETIGSGSICTDQRGYHHLRLGSYASRECIRAMHQFLVSKVKRERADRVLAWRSKRTYSHFGPTETNPAYAPAMALYVTGLSGEAVGRMVNVSGITVRRWARRAGVYREEK